MIHVHRILCAHEPDAVFAGRRIRLAADRPMTKESMRLLAATEVAGGWELRVVHGRPLRLTGDARYMFAPMLLGTLAHYVGWEAVEEDLVAKAAPWKNTSRVEAEPWLVHSGLVDAGRIETVAREMKRLGGGMLPAGKDGHRLVSPLSLRLDAVATTTLVRTFVGDEVRLEREVRYVPRGSGVAWLGLALEGGIVWGPDF